MQRAVRDEAPGVTTRIPVALWRSLTITRKVVLVSRAVLAIPR
jgi:hypothetical protein